MATIVLTGGGSAGHCIPHLAVLPHLREKFDKIYYIGSKNGIEKDIITNAEIQYFSVDCAKLNRKICLKNLTIPFHLLKGIKEAGKILDKLKPNVVFSKGGYVSVPTVIAAKKRNIPVVTHESDITAGVANKFISKYAVKVLTSFYETAKEFKNGEYVGSPIRYLLVEKEKKDLLKNYGLKGDKPVLLITGGSLGSTAINNAVKNALPSLLKNFDVIHICGKGNVKKEPKKEGYYKTEFVHDVAPLFNVADVCVSRAGANTVFELLSLNKPCVFIPLPKGASRGDQVLNAEYFQKKGVCAVLPQNVLTGESLTFAVNCVYKNRYSLIKNLTENPVQNASEKIAEILWQASRKD